MIPVSLAGARRLTTLCATIIATAVLFILPAAAGAVQPNLAFTTVTSGFTNAHSATINAYGNAVTFTATCQISNNGINSSAVPCDYNGYWVSIGMSVFTEGAHTITVVATATDGSNQSKTLTSNFTSDWTAPDTTILTGPNGNSISGHTAQWTFGGSDANGIAGFNCSIDGSPLASCTNSQLFSGLDDGDHTFQVQAIDNAGNTDPSPATASFTVSNAPPTAAITMVNGTSYSPGETRYVNYSSVYFHLTTSRDDAQLECRVDGAAWQSCTTGSHAVDSLSDGQHVFEVRAFLLPGPTDVQDPPAGSTIVVDTVAPTATVPANAKYFGGTSAQIDWGSDEEVFDSDCDLDGVYFAPCPTTFTGLTGGEHTLELWVMDRAGNWSQSTVATFRVFPAPPDTTITPGQAPAAAVDTATFTLSADTAGSTFECRVDGDAFKPCGSPATVIVGSHTGGAHVFEARATDLAGQTDPTPASTAFTLNAPAAIPAPKVSKLSARGKRLSLTVNAAGKLAVKVETCKKKRHHKAKCKRYTSGSAVATKAGRLKLKLKKALKKKHKYRVTVTSMSPTGAKLKKTFTIKAK